MKVEGVSYRTIWVKKDDPGCVQIIDQRYLPHRFVVEDLKTVDAVADAIRNMHVRGAPLIGVAAAYGMYLAARELRSGHAWEAELQEAGARLQATRPTAVNLRFGIERMLQAVRGARSREEAAASALAAAHAMAEEEVQNCERIGEHGFGIIARIREKKKGTVNILTHCNAGWLACVDWGTATAPIYRAFDSGIDVHVWVDETRPRVQGASLTAWELGQHKVPHTVVVDSASGHLMQRGSVDVVFVGTDRTTATGDVANKIGTYPTALAAQDNGIPFYVAAPSSSIDWNLSDGLGEIPIEERSAGEVTHVEGWNEGKITKVRITPDNTPAVNYAFDVTPRRLVTGLITERGVARAGLEDLLRLFPEKRTVSRHPA